MSEKVSIIIAANMLVICSVFVVRAQTTGGDDCNDCQYKLRVRGCLNVDVLFDGKPSAEGLYRSHAAVVCKKGTESCKPAFCP